MPEFNMIELPPVAWIMFMKKQRDNPIRNTFLCGFIYYHLFCCLKLFFVLLFETHHDRIIANAWEDRCNQFTGMFNSDSHGV